MEKKFVLLLLKSKYEWNLNDLAKDFQLNRVVSTSIHGRSIVKSSYPGALNSFYFVRNIYIF